MVDVRQVKEGDVGPGIVTGNSTPRHANQNYTGRITTSQPADQWHYLFGISNRCFYVSPPPIHVLFMVNTYKWQNNTNKIFTSAYSVTHWGDSPLPCMNCPNIPLLRNSVSSDSSSPEGKQNELLRYLSIQVNIAGLLSPEMVFLQLPLDLPNPPEYSLHRDSEHSYYCLNRKIK